MFQRKFTETMKNVSDISDRITFIVLGIGNTVQDLIGHHPSVHRHIRGIHIPYMENEEISELIEMGERESGITFTKNAREIAILLSTGLPYLAQLFCLHATRAAAERKSNTITLKDVEQARLSLIDEIDPTLSAQYAACTRGERSSHMLDILYAASACEFDQFGSFTAADVASVLLEIRGFETPMVTIETTLGRLSSDRGGVVLEKLSTPWGGKRYVFTNPTMRQCVLLRQSSRILELPNDDLKHAVNAD
jgi:hypothetical protein